MDKAREMGAGCPPRTGELVLNAVRACQAVGEAWALLCAAPEPLSGEAEELLWRALRLAQGCTSDVFTSSSVSDKI